MKHETSAKSMPQTTTLSHFVWKNLAESIKYLTFAKD